MSYQQNVQALLEKYLAQGLNRKLALTKAQEEASKKNKEQK